MSLIILLREALLGHNIIMMQMDVLLELETLPAIGTYIIMTQQARITAKFYQYYLQDTSLTNYRVLEYFPNGLLKKTTDFRRVTSGAPLTESGSMTQDFNAAGQLLKRSYYSATNKVWPYHYSVYTHLPDWVIKEEHYQNTNNIPVLDFTSYYTFDNKKLPFILSDFHKDGWGYGNVLLFLLCFS